MNGFLTLLLTNILYLQTYANDVGPYFDSTDGEAWELNYGYYPYRSYQTTDIVSPQFRTLVDSPECHDDRYTFFTPRGFSVDAPGPMIVDSHGELVWAKSTGGQAYDLKVQELKGEKYLTYWVGDDRVRGHGAGDYYMLNAGYQQVRKISALNGLSADLHDLIITPNATALLTIYEARPHDLSEFREFDEGEPQYIWDSLFQEIDLETNELLFQWRASDHHAINETYKDIGYGGTFENAYDWYHMNSVEKDGFGNYLVSARYTHTVTYINGTTGEIIWVLGGKRNMFEDLSDGFATNFAWQHDARLHSKKEFPELFRTDLENAQVNRDESGYSTQLVTLFDNSAEDIEHTLDFSRGLLLELTYPTQQDAVDSHNLSVTLIRSYDHPQHPLSTSQGSLQVVPSKEEGKDSKVFVGYGYNALYAEFTADGSLLCDNRFATNYSWGQGDVQSYRAFKFPWVGRPIDPPTAVFATDDVISVSWNGATEVAGWIVQHSKVYTASEEAWKDIVDVNKTGFETAIKTEHVKLLRYVRVKAIDEAGVTLGVSREIDMGWTAELTSTVPHLETSDMGPVKLIVLACINITAMFVFYELFKRVYTWRQTYKRLQRRGIRLPSDA